MHKHFFRILVNNDIFKILFTKRKLMRYYYFINIYIAYRNRAFILINFEFFNFSVIKMYVFLSIFIFDFGFVYKFLNLQFSAFFSFKLAF